jgi:hypothetical protein
MQEAASQGRSQQRGRRSPVLGIGAAVVASAVTLVIMMSNRWGDAGSGGIIHQSLPADAAQTAGLDEQG